MKKNRNALLAGMFIVVSLVLIVAIIGAVKGFGSFAELRSLRRVSFRLSDDIGGLRVGDDVRLGGLKVGVIRSIEPVGLDEAEPQLIVNFMMPSRYALRPNAKVGVQQTITGSSSLNIESLGTGTPLAEGEIVAGRPDPKTALFAALGELSPDLKKIASDVRTQTLPKVNAVAERTGEVMVQVRDLVGDTKTDFRGTMSNLNSVTATVKEKVPVTMERANTLLANMNQTVEKAQSTLEDVKKTVANAREISASAKSVIVGNKGKLDGMIASLKTTGDNLKHASAEIRRSPWRLLYKPGANEMANLNLYDSARQFADGANSLNDAAQSLRDALQDKETDPSRIQKLVEKLDTSFDNFHQVEDKLWTRVRE